jgi:hypothetical protein
VFFRVFGVLLPRNTESSRIYKKFKEFCNFSENVWSYSEVSENSVNILRIYGEECLDKS